MIHDSVHDDDEFQSLYKTGKFVFTSWLTSVFAEYTAFEGETWVETSGKITNVHPKHGSTYKLERRCDGFPAPKIRGSEEVG